MITAAEELHQNTSKYSKEYFAVDTEKKMGNKIVKRVNFEELSIRKNLIKINVGHF